MRPGRWPVAWISFGLVWFCALSPAFGEDGSSLTIRAGRGAQRHPTAFDRIYFLYIEANVGGSAGGHTALRIGDNVYHYQLFPDRVFRLVRDDWADFLHLYNRLENRTIHTLAIAVPPDGYRRLNDRLQQLRLIQKKHDQNLLALAAQRELFLARSATDEAERHVPIPALGFFAGTERVEERVIEQTQWPSENPVPYRPDPPRKEHYPAFGSSASDIYLEGLSLAWAREVIRADLPLAPESLFIPGRAGENILPLNARERANLVAFRAALLVDRSRLLESRRSDRGTTLLLLQARIKAIELSLKENRLILLDPFPANALRVAARSLQEFPEEAAGLVRQAAGNYSRWREFVIGGSTVPDERTYNMLEAVGARFEELDRGRLGYSQIIRTAQGRMIPSRSENSPIGPDVSGPAQATVAAQIYEHYLEDLRAVYGYNIIARNCTTELFRTLEAAFDGETTAALGGHLAPGERLSFIPFVSFDLVEGGYRVVAKEHLPGARERRLADASRTQNAAWLYVREANVFSAQLYNRRTEDSHFVFFTDDVFWPRPIYGSVNLLYGMARTLIGIAQSPFDEGRDLEAGLYGMLYSVPELFFFNIRKGSYGHVDR
ncbi:MAG: hypothetical protein KDK35_04015 [Leptospiraceae bacterium]|nr:hypothetical protein [Leptospiraceae bacterium]